MTRPAADLIVRNTSEVLTMERAGLSGPRRGADLQETGRVERGAVAVLDDRIVWVGPESGLADAVETAPDAVTVDAGGNTVLPGFVDSHTHLIFGNDHPTDTPSGHREVL